MRGRMDSLIVLLAGASAPLGLLTLGAVAQLSSTRITAWIGSALYVVIVSILYFALGRADDEEVVGSVRQS